MTTGAADALISDGGRLPLRGWREYRRLARTRSPFSVYDSWPPDPAGLEAVPLCKFSGFATMRHDRVNPDLAELGEGNLCYY